MKRKENEDTFAAIFFISDIKNPCFKVLKDPTNDDFNDS